MAREPVEDRRSLPSVPVDPGRETARDHACEVALDAATGDVGERVRSVTEPPHVVQIAAGRREQILTVVVLVLEHAADEREAVRVDTGRRQADDDIAFLNVRSVDETVSLDDSYARAREVDLLVPVDPGKLGGLAPHERDARRPTDVRSALDELRDLLELDPVRRDVVEEDERIRACRRDVVDAVRGEIRAAHTQPPAHAGEDELRPDRVGGRGEKAVLVDRMQSGEGAEARRTRRLDRGSQPFDDRVAGRERDARLRVCLPSARHERECMRSTVTPVTAVSLVTSWTLDPLQLVPIAVLAIAYAARARTLSRRGQAVPRWRIGLFAGGIGLLLVAVASPVAAVGEDELFSFHMTQHLLLGDLAPLCLLAGLTGPLVRPLLALPGVYRLKALANPIVALPIWAANLALWHMPFLYEGAVENGAVHALEHVCFFAAGIVLWLPVLETLPAPEWFGTGAKLGYIIGVRLIATVVGNVFVWGGGPYYDVYDTGNEYLGLSPSADQSLAGSLMLLEGSIVTIVAIAWLFLRMAQEGEVRQQLLEDGHDPRAVRRAVRYRRWHELA